ncbi:hypothetical protein L4D09_12690 [Photobacterium makurazakiensis]|uniref:hypothetical protein n=1 Tax=Photobacterium makurazakiensis TaxID=2910234 RepID=UPI003D10F61A
MRNHQDEFSQSYKSELIDNEGNVYRYTICNPAIGKTFSAIGGAFVGIISVGLAELQEYHLDAVFPHQSPLQHPSLSSF